MIILNKVKTGFSFNFKFEQFGLKNPIESLIYLAFGVRLRNYSVQAPLEQLFFRAPINVSRNEYKFRQRQTLVQPIFKAQISCLCLVVTDNFFHYGNAAFIRHIVVKQESAYRAEGETQGSRCFLRNKFFYAVDDRLAFIKVLKDFLGQQRRKTHFQLLQVDSLVIGNQNFAAFHALVELELNFVLRQSVAHKARLLILGI